MKLSPSVFTLLSSFFLGPAALAGCGAETAAEETDDVVDTTEDEIQGGRSNFGYFIVTRRDARRCVSPLCGGFFVKRVNDATTRCADGSLQPECYVESIRMGGAKLSPREEADFRAALESGHALVHARMYKKRWNQTTLGTLKADEAWLGASGSAPDGTFYRVHDNGIRCIQAPCPSQIAAPLNGGQGRYNVVSVGLENTPLPASNALLERAQNALGTDEGILLAGGVAVPRCLPQTQCGPMVHATEFYVRIVRREGGACGGLVADPSAMSCNPGQFCSWAPEDICGAADAPGTCAYKPEACVQVYAPVCACDGKTYGNACTAAAAGVSVSSQGACAN